MKTICKPTDQMAEIIKSKEKFHQNPATVKQTKPESGLSKQLLCNLQIENSCDRKQLETEVKNRVAYKKICIWEVF